MLFKFRRFMKGKRGQGMTEYIVIVGLVGIAAISMFMAFGEQIGNGLDALGHQLSGDNDAVVYNSDLKTQAEKGARLDDFKNDY
jgi:Flp pilus assembly pilin Flp